MTVLLVAHDVNPILGYLDRVVYFAGGRGVEGAPREVITSPTLSRLYGVPIEVLETSDGPPRRGRPAGGARPPPPGATIMVTMTGGGLSWNPVSDFNQLTAFPFMVHALEAGTIVAVMAGAIGWFMVLRRQTFAGHTLSVIAFPGAAGATLAGLPMALGYFGFCGGGALIAAAVRRPGRAANSSESAAIGTVQAFGLGLGFLFVSLYSGQLSEPGVAAVRHLPRHHRRPGADAALGRLAAVAVLAVIGPARCCSPRSTPRSPGPRAFRCRPFARGSCCCSGWRWRRPPRSPAPCWSSPCSSRRRPPRSRSPPGPAPAWRSRWRSPSRSPGSASGSPTSRPTRSASG